MSAQPGAAADDCMHADRVTDATAVRLPTGVRTDTAVDKQEEQMLK